MLQQINFYPLLPKSPRYKITPMLSVQASAGLFGLLIMIYLFNLIGYAWQQHTLTRLTQERQSVQQQLNALNERYIIMQNKPLRWQNQQLAAELNAKQIILTKIKQSAPIGLQGYTKYLLGFAETIAPDVWLTGINIKEGDQQIDLTGNAMNSAAIMQFIQNMGKNAVFNNKTFNVLRLDNATENAQVIHFTLSTAAREQNANNSIRKTS